jgi:hypothetical protein
MIVNVLIERIAYRRLRNAPRLAPLITAIGVSILLQTFAMMIWGRNPLPSRNCCRRTHHIGGALISPTQICCWRWRWPRWPAWCCWWKNQDGPRHARHGGKPARGRPDGRGCQPRHHRHLRASAPRWRPWPA